MATNKRTMKQQLQIIRSNMEYTITPPTHRGLILTGGSKGIAFLGLITALEDRGFLKKITHLCGSSAGAMAASLLAIGMNNENIIKLINKLDLTTLLDNSEIGFRAKGLRLRNVLDLIYMIQIKEHLDRIEKPISVAQKTSFTHLQKKITLYKQALTNKSVNIDNFDDIVHLIQSKENLIKIDQIFKNMPHHIEINKKEFETARITLGDLSHLRSLLPKELQNKIKNLTVIATNQTENTSEHFSELKTPQQSIAEVVQWSGAHPVFFVPGTNAKGHSIADGGILDNMPAIDNLDNEEILCAKAESNLSFFERGHKAEESNPEQITNFKAFLDEGIRIAIGGQWLHAIPCLMNREIVFHEVDNMLFINTGDLSTTNMSPTQEQKKFAIKNGYEQTIEFLEGQKKNFDHPLLAILYVGIDHLDQRILDEHYEPKLFKAIIQAKRVTELQKHIIKEMEKGDSSQVQSFIKQLENLLTFDADLNSNQKSKVFSLCIKQVNCLSNGKLQKFLNHIVIKEKAAAKKETEDRMPSFGWEALKALWIPIEWVTSRASTPTPEIEIKISPRVIDTEKYKAQNQLTDENSDRSLRIKEKLAELKDRTPDSIQNPDDKSEHQTKTLL